MIQESPSKTCLLCSCNAGQGGSHLKTNCHKEGPTRQTLNHPTAIQLMFGDLWEWYWLMESFKHLIFLPTPQTKKKVPTSIFLPFSLRNVFFKKGRKNRYFRDSRYIYWYTILSKPLFVLWCEIQSYFYFLWCEFLSFLSTRFSHFLATNPYMIHVWIISKSIKNWMGPNPNGPLSVSCDRYMKILRFFPGSVTRGSCLEISWIKPTKKYEKWRFYTPNIWVITPKNEGCGFPWY